MDKVIRKSKFYYYKKTGNPEKPEQESEIEVNYQLGGMNYFSGRGEARGVYVSFTKVIRHTMPGGYSTKEFCLMGKDAGFKILALELSRKSAKRIEETAEKVEYILDQLHEMHIAGDKDGLFRAVKGLYAPAGSTIKILEPKAVHA